MVSNPSTPVKYDRAASTSRHGSTGTATRMTIPSQYHPAELLRRVIMRWTLGVYFGQSDRGLGGLHQVGRFAWVPVVRGVADRVHPVPPHRLAEMGEDRRLRWLLLALFGRTPSCRLVR